MVIQLHVPNAVRFNDKMLLFCCALYYLTIRIFIRIIIGRKRRDKLFINHNLGWMSPISGRRLLIKNEQGFRFWIRANSSDTAIISTENERDVLAIFNPSKGDIVIDIGSNIGKYTIHTANLVRTKRSVISLEPFKETFDLLCENIKENDLEEVVIPICVAAFDKNGKVEMHFSEHAWSKNSLVYQRGKRHIEVSTVTLDSLLTDMKIDRVDWIKIDVEGAEYNVLCGALDTLRKNKARLIIEVLSMNKEKVLSLLESLGYSVSILESYEVNVAAKQGYYNLFAEKSNSS